MTDSSRPKAPLSKLVTSGDQLQRFYGKRTIDVAFPPSMNFDS